MIANVPGTVKSLVAPEVFQEGIVVTIAAAAYASPVAEFTLAAILFANKNVLGFVGLYRFRRQAAHPEHLTETVVGNWHKTAGIVGVSRIGRRVIELPKPFDLSVLAHDPYLDATGACALGVEKLGLDAMIARSDVLTLDAPALKVPRHMIDALRLAPMKDGATRITTARGWLVDHAALKCELVPGRTSAVIDLTE